jgi:hypothetical protein
LAETHLQIENAYTTQTFGWREAGMSMEVVWKRLNEEWFYSKRAIGLFAAVSTIAISGAAFGEFGPRNFINSNSFVLQLSFTLAMMTWAVGTLTVMVGMLRYWTKYDRSSQIVRWIWLAIMIVGFFFGLATGCALYCFAVYLPQRLMAVRAKALN